MNGDMQFCRMQIRTIDDTNFLEVAIIAKGSDEMILGSVRKEIALDAELWKQYTDLMSAFAKKVLTDSGATILSTFVIKNTGG